MLGHEKGQDTRYVRSHSAGRIQHLATKHSDQFSHTKIKDALPRANVIRRRERCRVEAELEQTMNACDI